MNFDAIRRRREGFAFSVDDVARIGGLSADRLLSIESGLAAPVYLDEINRLGHALAFDPLAWMDGEDLEDPCRAVARFRSEANSRLHPSDLRLMARAAQFARLGEALRSDLGLPGGKVTALRQIKAVARGGKTPPYKQGYALGQAARLALAPDAKPLPSMQRLLEGCGVHVAHVRFESPKIHAVSLNEEGAVPVILLNTGAVRTSQRIPRRAALAHELCHLLHDGGARHHLLTLVSWEDSPLPEEQRANGFAPAFLAPPAWLSTEREDAAARVVEVGERWGLSAQGAVWHCKNSNLIAPLDAAHLDRYPPRVKPGRFEPEIARRLVPEALADVERAPMACGLIGDWAIQAFEADLISGMRARELLSWQ
jgi:Zn-dependent peptidase ImmA (M78 family)